MVRMHNHSSAYAVSLRRTNGELPVFLCFKTKVRLLAERTHFDKGPETSALDWIAANSVESDALPTDLADEHDHYLYGRSKKDSGTRI